MERPTGYVSYGEGTASVEVRMFTEYHVSWEKIQALSLEKMHLP